MTHGWQPLRFTARWFGVILVLLVLPACGSDEPRQSVSGSIEDLGSSDVAVRRRAVEALMEFGPAAAPAVEALTETLQDGEVAVAALAPQALARVGPAAAPAVPSLVQVMREHPSERVRAECARALGKLRLSPETVVPALVHAMETGKIPKTTAILALSSFGSEATSAVPSLIRLLGDEEHGTLAMSALGLIGEASESVPALIGILANPSIEDRRKYRAVRALAAIGAPAIDELLSYIKATYSFHGIDALGWMGPAAAPAVPALVELLKDPTSKPGDWRERTAWALGRIGPAAREAVPALRAAAAQGLPYAQSALEKIRTDS